MRGIKLVQVGRIQKAFFREAFEHYLKKARFFTPVEHVAVKEVSSKNVDLRVKKEGERLLERIASKDLVLALDEQGKMFSSRGLAGDLDRWETDPARLPCFVLGGAYGLSREVKSRADCLMSLGSITLPHELSAVVIMEQIYRGFSINKGHPYHH